MSLSMKLFVLVFLAVHTVTTQAELTLEDVMGFVHTLAGKHDELDAKVSKIIVENNFLKRQVSDLQNRNDILVKNVTDLSVKYENIVQQSNACLDKKNKCEKEKMLLIPNDVPLRKEVKQFMKDSKKKETYNSQSSAQENSSEESSHYRIRRSSITDFKNSERIHAGSQKPYSESEAQGGRKTAMNRSQRTISLPDVTHQKGSVQIGFLAELNGEIINPKDNQQIHYGNVRFNRGSAYNSNTGTFTCPVSGTYVFHMSVITNAGKLLETQLVRNGQDTGCVVYCYNDNYGDFASNMIILDLNQGDEVWVRVYDSIHSNGNVLALGKTTFSGFILWEH